MVLIKKQNYSQGTDSHAETIEFDAIGQHVGNPSSILGLDTMLRMASVARVNRRLRRYYLIVRLLPNVFALAYRSLGSIYYDTGSPHDGKTPFGWLHPCRLVTDSRRYLIVGAPAAMPLYSSFIFSLNNRACQQLAKLLLLGVEEK